MVATTYGSSVWQVNGATLQQLFFVADVHQREQSRTFWKLLLGKEQFILWSWDVLYPIQKTIVNQVAKEKTRSSHKNIKCRRSKHVEDIKISILSYPSRGEITTSRNTRNKWCIVSSVWLINNMLFSMKSYQMNHLHSTDIKCESMKIVKDIKNSIF